MRRSVPMLLALSTACGRIGFDARALGDTGNDSVAPDCITAPVSDDFSGSSTRSIWMTFGSQFAQSGGDLVITLPSNSTVYTGYFTSVGYDLRESCTFVTFDGLPSATDSVEMQYAWNLTPGYYIGVTYTNTTLEYYWKVNTTIHNILVAPYDPVAQRIVRLRETGGTTYFDTSPDGVTYTTQTSIADPFDLSNGQIYLDAGSYTNVATPGIARFAKFDSF